MAIGHCRATSDRRGRGDIWVSGRAIGEGMSSFAIETHLNDAWIPRWWGPEVGGSTAEEPLPGEAGADVRTMGCWRGLPRGATTWLEENVNAYWYGEPSVCVCWCFIPAILLGQYGS